MFHSPGSVQALSDLFDFSGFPPEGFELPVQEILFIQVNVKHSS